MEPTMAKTGVKVAFFLVCLLSLAFTLVQGENPAPKKKPFLCANTDICNREGSNWQYCDFIEERCVYCEAKKEDCLSPKMPLNCSYFCKEDLLKQERVKGCGPLDQPSNGSHNGSETGHRYRDLIELTCDQGYICDGPCFTTCSAYGLYTSQLICKENLLEAERVKGCPPMNDTKHGHHNGSRMGQKFGEVVQLECDPDFQCEGLCVSECLDFGHYSQPLKCKENKEEERGPYFYPFVVVCVVLVICCVIVIACCRIYELKKKYSCKSRSTGASIEYDQMNPKKNETLIPMDNYANQPLLDSEKPKSVDRLLYRSASTVNANKEEAHFSQRGRCYTSESEFDGDPNLDESRAEFKDSGFSQKMDNGNGDQPVVVYVTNYNNNNPSFNNNQSNNNAQTFQNNKETNKPDDQPKPTTYVPPVYDKLSTEETGEGKSGVVDNACHGELDDPAESLSSSQGAGDTPPKQPTGTDCLNNSQQSLGFQCQEQTKEKDFPESHFHNQARSGNAEPPKFGIGDKLINVSDVFKQSKDTKDRSQLHSQAGEDADKLRTMALNQHPGNQDDILGEHERQFTTEPMHQS